MQTRLKIDRSLIMLFHTFGGYIFAVLLIFHFLLSILTVRMNWRRTIKLILEKGFNKWPILRLLQRLSAWSLLLSASIMVITGLSWENRQILEILPFTPHIQWDIITALSLVLHGLIGVISAATRNRIKLPLSGFRLIILSSLLITSILYTDMYFGRSKSHINDDPIFSDDHVSLNKTMPTNKGTVSIGQSFNPLSKRFNFDPSKVQTLRPDIFKPGYFSVFDILVHLSEVGQVDLRYHFEEELNTYVIDRLEGETNWWYLIYYDGGWSESNYYRMDHYPWKDGSTLNFYEVSPKQINEIHEIFREEIEKLEKNDGKTIIPRVYINGLTYIAVFENVTVTPHNLRPDLFQDNITTGIDIIMSLGDQGKLNYTLKWYESIASARIVKNFWVESIGPDISKGRCGFVYETGSDRRKGKGGNHIHLPSDSKVIYSPDYSRWFWICV
jgi:hypothetical protein